MLAFLLGKFLKVEWLDHGRCFVYLVKKQTNFPKVVVPLYMPACSSTNQPTTVMVSLLILAISNGSVGVSHCCFNFHFPAAWWCGASFHRFDIGVSSFIKCSYLFALFVLCCFLIIEFWGFITHSRGKSLIKYIIGKYFLPIDDLSFYFLNAFQRAVLIPIKPNLLI